MMIDLHGDSVLDLLSLKIDCEIHFFHRSNCTQFVWSHPYFICCSVIAKARANKNRHILLIVVACGVSTLF